MREIHSESDRVDHTGSALHPQTTRQEKPSIKDCDIWVIGPL